LHSKIIEIANKLNKQFLDKSQNLNEISIFLCGGSGKEEEKFRRKVGEKICSTSKLSNYKYSVYYPEDMFIELILGHQKQDLLTLENLLADSASAVVILLQSPGTFTELGAFTNYKKLNNKLIVIIDPKYARKRSFINLGPIRFLKKTKSKVLSIKMDNSNFNKLVEQITDSARDIAKHSSPIRDLTNPIFAYKFYLALIYIFEPIPKDAIFAILRLLADNEERNMATVAEIVINSLINERSVFLSVDNLLTTLKGSDDLIYDGNTKKRSQIVSVFLTELRLEALNLICRKNYRRIWGEAKKS